MSDSIFQSGDITVTPSIFSVGNRQYQIRQITVLDVKTSAPGYKLPLFGSIIFGGIVGNAAGSTAGYIAFFIALIGLSFYAYQSVTHTLVVTTAGGASDAITSKDPDLIAKTRSAINEAQAKLAAA